MDCRSRALHSFANSGGVFRGFFLTMCHKNWHVNTGMQLRKNHQIFVAIQIFIMQFLLWIAASLRSLQVRGSIFPLITCPKYNSLIFSAVRKILILIKTIK